MERYQWTLRDSEGRPVSGGTIAVFNSATQLAATIYPANTTTEDPVTPLGSHIVTSGSDGLVQFAAPNGDYDLYFTSGDLGSWWLRWTHLYDGTAGVQGAQGAQGAQGSGGGLKYLQENPALLDDTATDT